MELSTNIPIPMQSPASDITFNVIPVKYITIIAQTTLNGILKATITVGLTFFKNKARTIIARIAPNNILCKTVFTITLIYSLWSIKDVHDKPLYLPSIVLKADLIFPATSLVLAVLDL